MPKTSDRYATGAVSFSGGAVGDLMIRSGAATIGPIGGSANAIPYFNSATTFGANILFTFDTITGYHGVGIAVALERLHVASGNARFDGRVLSSKGADVASANDLTLGGDGNCFTITGVVQINAITTTNWISGSHITLIFSGATTVKHNTAGGAGTAVLLLAGSVDLITSANTVLGLVYDGTQWQEMYRKAA